MHKKRLTTTSRAAISCNNRQLFRQPPASQLTAHVSRLPLVRHEEATNGVAILIKDSSRITNPQQFPLADPDGRLLRVDFDLHGNRYYVINVYAPCQGRHRPAFATRLQAIFPTDGRLVLMVATWTASTHSMTQSRPHAHIRVASSALRTLRPSTIGRPHGRLAPPPPRPLRRIYAH